MKKIISLFSILMAVLMIVSSIPAFACDSCEEELTYKGFSYWESSDGQAIYGYSGKRKHIKIPSKIDGKEVRYVDLNYGYVSFDGSPIESIYVPDSVRDLSVSMHENLKTVTISKNNKYLKVEGKLILNKKGTEIRSCINSIKNLEVSNKVKRIVDEAFTGSNLRKVILGKNVIEIGEQAFEDCKQLKEVKLNKKLKEIEYAAFDGCVGLKSVEIPNKIKIIPNSAFAGCKKMKSVDLGKVEVIDDGAFNGCKKLTDVKFSKKLKTIGYGAFGSCVSIEELNLPKNLEYIDNSAFRNCKSLKSIKIPRKIKVIESFTFEKCKNLTEVKLNKNLEEIKEFAFYKCENLKEISIPKSVKRINECVFSKCDNLNDVYIYNPECEFYIRDEYQKLEGYDWKAIPSNVKIHGYKDSTAQKYAEANGNEFVELD